MRLIFRSKAAESTQYRADIDGLRAIAVLSVVLFHAGVDGFGGGFVGVDIFFVISGYLITSVIQREIDRGRFSFQTFYDRRIRRILPALFCVVLACTVVTAVLFPTQRFKDFGTSLLALSGSVSNVYFSSAGAGTGYFAPAAGEQWLLHTWSLSVEEQFYLLFPMVLLFLNKRMGGKILAVLVTALLLSFGVGVYGVAHTPVAAFYLLPGRAWELLVGAILVYKPLPVLSSYAARTLAGLAGLAAVGYGVGALSNLVPFPGTSALYPCVGAGLVLYSGQDGDSLVQRLLGFGPLVFVGAISYSLYLWHWPLLMLARYFFVTPRLEAGQKIGYLGLCVLLAVLSFEFIETPCRTRRREGVPSRRVIVTGVALSAAMAVAGACIVATNGLPQRMPRERMQRLDVNYARKAEFVDIGDCANYRMELAQYTDAHFCEVAHRAKNVLVWGDSHVSQIYPLLVDMQAKGDFGDRGLVFAVAGACPPATSVNLARPGFHCDRFARYAMQRAEQGDIDTVYLQFSPWWVLSDGALCGVQAGVCTGSLTGEQAEVRVSGEVSDDMVRLRAEGRRVILGLPFPIYTLLIPDLEIRNAGLGRLRRYAIYPVEISSASMRRRLQEAAGRDSVAIYDPRATLCPGGNCTYAVDGYTLYSDETHVASSQLEILRAGLSRALRPSP